MCTAGWQMRGEMLDNMMIKGGECCRQQVCFGSQQQHGVTVLCGVFVVLYVHRSPVYFKLKLFLTPTYTRPPVTACCPIPSARVLADDVRGAVVSYLSVLKGTEGGMAKLGMGISKHPALERAEQMINIAWLEVRCVPSQSGVRGICKWLEA